MKVKVWYAKRTPFPIVSEAVTLDRLTETHVWVADIKGNPTFDEVWTMMQANVWSPMGEAAELIERKNAAHVSMNFGDVVYREGAYYVLTERNGWRRLKRQEPIGDVQYIGLMKAANDFRYLATVTSLDMPNNVAILHLRRTSKSAMDDWLMNRFGLTEVEAREVSNSSGEIVEFSTRFNAVEWLAERERPVWEEYPELTHWKKAA